MGPPTDKEWAALDLDFPHLRASNPEFTSEPTKTYNCIAWAFGRTDRNLWPGDDGWPTGLPESEDVASFAAAFATIGFEECAGPDLETSFEKVALYVADGNVTHAARQLSTGRYSSKLGKGHDVTHTLDGIAGPLYGKPAAFLRRPRAQ